MGRKHRILAFISGLPLIVLAMFVGGVIVSAYSFIIAFSFFLLSETMFRQQRRLGMVLAKLGPEKHASRAQNKRAGRQFVWIFVFYACFGAVFIILPLMPACAVCTAIVLSGLLIELTGFLSKRHKRG